MEGLQGISGMQDKDIMKVIAEAQLHEQRAFEAFCAKYDLQFPMPESPNVRLMGAIGWQFITILIQSAASIILAALRTGHMFYEAAAAANIIIRYIDAGVSIFAIEFGVVVFSAIKAEAENRRNTEADLRSSLNINIRLLWTGIIACVVISIVAGVGTSMAGFGLDTTWFQWVLVVFMGAGASLVSWVSGEILGAMLARFNNARALAEMEYRKDLAAREADKNAKWEAAPERSIARTELVELKEYLAATRFRAERKPRTRSPQPQEDRDPVRTDVREKVFAYLDRIWQQEARVAGPSELKRETGASKSHCSETLIPEWRASRNVPVNEPAPAEERSNGHET